VGEVIWGYDFTPQKGAKDTQIRTREDAIDYMAAEFAKMLEPGDTLLVLECKNGETLNIHNFAGSATTSATPLAGVEMPADCPA
jgi:hypothetical protein